MPLRTRFLIPALIGLSGCTGMNEAEGSPEHSDSTAVDADRLAPHNVEEIDARRASDDPAQFD